METFDLREKNVDGTAVIVELKDDIYLTVNPPKGSGKHVTIEAIKQQLIDKRVSSPIDFEIVKQAIEMCSQGSPTTSSYGTGYPIKISSIDGEKIVKEDGKMASLPSNEVKGWQDGKPALERSKGMASPFAPLPPYPLAPFFKITKNIKKAIGIGDVDVTISEDEMEAYITVYLLPKKNKETYIIEKIMKKGVIYGVDEKKIFEVIRNNLFFKQILIAKGKAPKEGKNAELIFKFGINREEGTKIEHNGNTDYYYLDSAPHVKKNQVLVEKKLPVPAEMGISVKGYKIKPENSGGQDIPLPAGKNTVISEDGAKLLAAIDGYLTFSDGKFNIDRSCMVVKGDVDASIGVRQKGKGASKQSSNQAIKQSSNQAKGQGDKGASSCRLAVLPSCHLATLPSCHLAILPSGLGKVYFQGNVFVTGDVLKGFAVEADGDIEIQGCVNEASLNSKGGNVIIRKEIYKSNIEADGDVRIGIAKESVIYAKGNVLIDGDLLNCVVTGGKKVNVLGEKGIIGGEVRAGMGITANNIGSPDQVKTLVQIVEKDSQLFLIESKMNNAKELLSSLCQKLTTNTSKEQLFPMIEEYVAQKKRVSRLESERLELLKSKFKNSEEEEAPSLKEDKTIRVYDMIYDGVEIQIGEAKLRIKEEEHRTVFFRDGNYLTYSHTH